MYVCRCNIHVRLGKDVYLICTILARSLGICTFTCTVSERYDEKSRVTSLIEIFFFFFALCWLLENLILLFFFHSSQNATKKANYTYNHIERIKVMIQPPSLIANKEK